MEKNKCLICGHEWLPRTQRPVECPACKNRNWNQKKTTNGGMKNGSI